MSIKLKNICSILIVSIATFGLQACGFATDTCSDVQTGTNKLHSAQKKVGGFKKENTAHYVHSDGFEFDLTVTKDTNFIHKYRDFCVEIDREIQSRQLTSTYPVLSVNVELEADGETFSTLKISHDGTDYQFSMNNSAKLLETEHHVQLLDTITFNGVTYDSVYAVTCNSHYYYYDNDDYQYNQPLTPLTRLYFSFKKGILKFETESGKDFTIKEGGDDE